ncbi:hypothetical protein BSLG_001779 [Batrachochytrium salamandrivorans]|nr:hypothetical protein BSLG_001779 [Batrachochytrium salamandrivorans]
MSGRNSRSSLSTSMTDSTNYPQIPIVMPVPTRPGASVANRMTAALDAVNTFSRPEALMTISYPLPLLGRYPNPHYHSTIMNQLEAQLEALNHDFDDTLYSSAARRYRRRSSAGASTMVTVATALVILVSQARPGHCSCSICAESLACTVYQLDSSAGSINEKSYRLSWSIRIIPFDVVCPRYPNNFYRSSLLALNCYHCRPPSNQPDRSHLGVARSANDGPSLQQ